MSKRLFAAVTAVVVLVVGGTAIAQTQRFSDVPADHPQAAAIEWAADVGVTAGYDNGTFRPDQPLHRDHAAIFLERFYDQILESDQSDGFTRGDMMALLHEINGPQSKEHRLLMDQCLRIAHDGFRSNTGDYAYAWFFEPDQIRDQCQRWTNALLANPDDFPLVIRSDVFGEWIEVHSTAHGYRVAHHYTHAENMQAIEWVHNDVLEHFPSLEDHLNDITYVFNDLWTCRNAEWWVACASHSGPDEYVVSTGRGFLNPATYYHEIGHTILFAALHLDPELAGHDYKSECRDVSLFGRQWQPSTGWTPTGQEPVEYGCWNLDEYTAEAFTNIMVGGMHPDTYDIFCAGLSPSDLEWWDNDLGVDGLSGHPCNVPPGPHAAGAAWIDRLIDVIGR